jgi:hypothetical protein
MSARGKQHLFVYEIRTIGTAQASYSYGLWYGTMPHFRRDILQGEYRLARRKDMAQNTETGRRLIGLLLMDEVNQEHVLNDALDGLILAVLDLS